MPTREQDRNESEQEILARAKKDRLRLWARKCTRMFDVGGEAVSYWQKYGITCPHSRPGRAVWGDNIPGANMSFCEEYSNGKCRASGTSCKGLRGCTVPFPYRRICDAGKGFCCALSGRKEYQAALKPESKFNTDCPKMYSTGQPAFVDALRKHQA